VVNLMEALRQSLERVSSNKKKAARAVSQKPAAKAAAAPRKRARG
jgi:non-homologous end joining protein Ku